nr:hypothetical protein BgiMline_010500 [Biomphalaria glabrata]
MMINCSVMLMRYPDVDKLFRDVDKLPSDVNMLFSDIEKRLVGAVLLIWIIMTFGIIQIGAATYYSTAKWALALSGAFDIESLSSDQVVAYVITDLPLTFSRRSIMDSIEGLRTIKEYSKICR